MCTRAKVFKYEIIKTMPLSMLENYKGHKRLRVFYNKGVISKFVTNTHINELQFMIEGNSKSMYSIKRAYVKI